MTQPDEYWAWFTGLWFGTGAIAFGVKEFWEIFHNHREGTYTFWIRTKLGIEYKRPGWVEVAIIFAFIILGFAVWFAGHIALGIWGGAAS